VDLPVNVDAVIDDAAQTLVRTMATTAGKQVVSWVANLWRRKKNDDVSDVTESIEQDAAQLSSTDGPVRVALSEALQRKWVGQLRELLRNDPEVMAELIEVTEQLRAHVGSQSASNPVQFGVNSGSGDFYQATNQTINKGRR